MVELDALRSGRPGTSEEYLDVYYWLCEEIREDTVQNSGPFLVFTNSTHLANKARRGAPPHISIRAGSRDRQLTGKDVRFYLLGAGLSKDQAHRVWEQLDENGNGKVSYPERDAARKSEL